MMKKNARLMTALAAAFCLGGAAQATTRAAEFTTAYVEEPAPPGFKVMISELEGPIFTLTDGRPVYQWPRKELRNGGSGDVRTSMSACENTKTTVNEGFMSPYPAGLVLPELDTRPTCVEAWPPVIAPADAKPVGKWTLINRRDKTKQWAYEGFALYTSAMDREPGIPLGGTRGGGRGDGPVVRIPISPPPDIPGQFNIDRSDAGHLLVAVGGATVYTSDKDGPNKSNCFAACEKTWRPILAPQIGAQARKDWTIIERKPGVKQWAFRSKPLYTYSDDPGPGYQDGMDVAGWNVVFTQRAPAPPKEFTTQETTGGVVLADAKGHTIYVYNCGDDSLDQLACDHPDTPQEYRYSVCGGGDPIRCAKNFPYVVAAKDAKAPNKTWTTMDIDPATGRRPKARTESLHVWAFRDRPVYTFAEDIPGTVKAGAWGEFYGARNGYRPFWLREVFQGR